MVIKKKNRKLERIFQELKIQIYLEKIPTTGS